MVPPTPTPVSKVSRLTAATPASALPQDVVTLQQMVLQLLGQINDKTRENFDLQCQLDWLRRQLFGRKSETMDPNQRLLFADLFEKLQQQLNQLPVSEPAATPPASVSKIPTSKRASQRNGRAPLPADLPRVPEYIDPDPRLTENMRCIGEDTTEILEYIPAGFYVRQIIRRKYAPRGGLGSVVMAPLPALPIEKGRPGPGVLAYIITSKYCDHLPLYRLEQIFARHGLHIPRTTQWDWVRDSADLLVAIVLAMKRLILASDKIHTDDTHIPIQDKTRTQVREGYLWPHIDRANNVYFDYTTTRSREGPEQMLGGYQGYLQADAFNGYDGLYGKGKATEVGCWAHARRKFDEAKQTDPLRANEMLALIAQLYIIEKKAQEEDLDAEGVKALRQKFSKPILDDQIKPLLESWGPAVLPKSPIGKAVTYAVNQWEALNRYLENGILCIDNSLSERVIKLVALGRKNWLFSGSDGGAQRAAILYSLIASCKLCGIDPFLYLRDVLERINTHPANRIDELTPPQWKELFLPKISLPRFPAKAGKQTE
ncbi:MAG: IS66 family transposase [Candidatus Cryosericum sp.]